MTVKTIYAMTVNSFAVEVLINHYTEEQAQQHLKLRPGQYEAIKEFAKDFTGGGWKVKSPLRYDWCELDQDEAYVYDLEYHTTKTIKQVPTVGVSE